VLEELGRACAPGPFVPSVLASAVVDRLGDDDARHALLPGLGDGSEVGAVAFAGLDAVMGGALATLLVVPHDVGRWAVVRAADMLLALERARAVAWDAARPTAPDGERNLVAAVAGALAPADFFTCAKDCIQVLGGIGFTWEHDAHLYLKRATAIVALTGGGRD